MSLSISLLNKDFRLLQLNSGLLINRLFTASLPILKIFSFTIIINKTSCSLSL